MGDPAPPNATCHPVPAAGAAGQGPLYESLRADGSWGIEAMPCKCSRTSCPGGLAQAGHGWPAVGC